jgi:pimeloyl-ACP methyl ester carboxylesterase
MSLRPIARPSTLHGARDGAIGAELLGDLTPHLPVRGSVAEIVDGVGHFLHLEKPGLIAATIGDWLCNPGH